MNNIKAQVQEIEIKLNDVLKDYDGSHILTALIHVTKKQAKKYGTRLDLYVKLLLISDDLDKKS